MIEFFRLQELKSELESLKQNQIAEIVKLKEKITLLWNLLDVSRVEQDRVFRRTIKGFGQGVLNAVREIILCFSLFSFLLL